MRVIVGVYPSHDEALDAIKILGSAAFPLKQVSLVGKVEIIDNQMSIKSLDPVKSAPAVIGSIMGPVVGLLTGIGIFAIPGFGFLYGAGAIIGMIAGFDLGVVTGGVVTLLATYGINKESVVRYEENISNGNFLVLVQGNLKEINQAEQLLHTNGKHFTDGKIFKEHIDIIPDLKQLKDNEVVYNKETKNT